MVEIKKTKDVEGYDRFKITTENGSFDIMFGGNLDLYWYYWPEENYKDWPLAKTFTISKENYFIYQKLDELYKNIKEQKPYQSKDENSSIVFDSSKLINDSPKSQYSYKNLFQNDIIKWYSDDAPLEEASMLEIKSQEDKYIITFHQGKEDFGFPTYAIRFRNSGSRYEPYNFAFMNMYNSLSEYDPNYHQIHIEEYLYQQKTLQKIKKQGA